MRVDYNPSLDGVRALAVLMVVAYHARMPVATGGFIGVDVFFVLSGYLITRILLAERARHGDIDFARFYARRLLRLGPPLACLVLTFLVVAPYAWPGRDAAEFYLSAFLASFYLYSHSMAMGDVPEFLSHT